jgi:glucose 1-dehydrogenase
MISSAVRPLQGQKALVTGASSEIGAAIAYALARAGAAIGVNYRSHGNDADEIIRQIIDQDGEAIGLKADVSREDEVHAMFERFVETFRRIDILVANAGIQKDAAITNMSLEDWRAVLDVNLTGQFLCVREAIRRFLAQGPAPASRATGKVICMSSVHELIPWAGHVNYAASKGGVMQMMKSVAQEVAEKRIRVNGIAPGAIKTNINKQVWGIPEAERKLLTLIPYGRVGEPEDVATAAVWLASDDSDYVIGTTLFVDGGMTLYPGFRENG